MPDWDELREQPPSFIDSEDIDGLREFAKANEEACTGDADLAWNVGWAFVRLSRFDEAIAYFRANIHLDSASANGHWALGIAFWELGKLTDAERELRIAIRLKDRWMSRHSLAVVLLETDRAEEGEQLLREGLSLKPSRKPRERLRELADYLDDMGKLEEANAIRATMTSEGADT